jgi:hypothetical protein
VTLASPIDERRRGQQRGYTLSLAKPPALGTIIPIPEVGGLHHRYVRRAA